MLINCLFVLPHIMSSVHNATVGKMSAPLAPVFLNFLTRISVFLLNTSRYCSKIFKWNVGVIIFLWVCHFFPNYKYIKYIRSEP